MGDNEIRQRASRAETQQLLLALQARNEALAGELAVANAKILKFSELETSKSNTDSVVDIKRSN